MTYEEKDAEDENEEEENPEFDSDNRYWRY
jgi:hypothetical protein